VGSSEETLGGVDQALAELGKTDDEISEVRSRFAAGAQADLRDVDAQLDVLCEGLTIDVPSRNVHTAPTRVPEAADATWEDEETEVEIIDESDFVLLVDEGDLEELERVGEDDATKTAPPAIPSDDEGGEQDEGFFKKLFGGRRSRPPQP
jgi:hypothetical protein